MITIIIVFLWLTVVVSTIDSLLRIITKDRFSDGGTLAFFFLGMIYTIAIPIWILFKVML